MNDTEKALDYYKTAAQQDSWGPFPKPRYIPKRILLLRKIRADFAYLSTDSVAGPGEHDAHCNSYGAVSVKTPGGLLGVMLDEFEVIEWCDNPHAHKKPEPGEPGWKPQ